MSKERTEVTSGGIGLPTLLGVLFIALKLTGVISWGWLWVLAPFWIPWVVLIAILILVGLGMIINNKN